MPNFPKGVAVALSDFVIRVKVHDDGVLPPTVEMLYHFHTVDVNGVVLAGFDGDVVPFLTGAQVTNFTNGVLALYTKAKTDALT